MSLTLVFWAFFGLGIIQAVRGKAKRGRRRPIVLDGEIRSRHTLG